MLVYLLKFCLKFDNIMLNHSLLNSGLTVNEIFGPGMQS